MAWENITGIILNNNSHLALKRSGRIATKYLTEGRASLKNLFLLCTRIQILVLSFFLLSSSNLIAQQDIQTLRADSINQLKIDGKLSGHELFTNSLAKHSKPSSGIVSSPPPPPPLSCKCWITRDLTWQIAALDGSGASGGPGLPPDYRNDDWSTLPIYIPFSFCFYGSPIDSLYINNNGNVSIGAPYSTFTANPFPDPNFVMIAPFWGDVDTRGPMSGLVYYQITPTHLVVQWEAVGYFNSHDDKLNTFQLILTDGLDPILPGGQNTSFCYKDMQWTTGDASSGTNGFGGTAATVGVNRGNGTDFIQVGLFDTAGAVYDGPFGNNDGIDVLDNQAFYFNSCVSSSNVAPLVTALQVCDTLKVCINDSIQIYAEYLSPEQNQITVPNVNPNGMGGVSILSSSTGNIASITVQVQGNASNVGYHTIYITGTDNGSPPLTNSTPVIVQVMPAPTPNFNFSPASPISPGTSVSFTNASVGAFGYSWNFGDGFPPSTAANPSHTYSTVGTYTVTLTATGPNGCSAVVQHQIIVAACASASFTVIDTLCAGTPAQVTFTGVASVNAVFDWGFGGATVLSGSGRGPYMVQWNSAGNQTVTLTLTDNPCVPVTASQPVSVIPIPVASISTSPVICVGNQSTVSFNGTALPYANFTWNLGTSTIVSGTGTVSDPYTLQWNTSGASALSVIVNQNGCADTTQLNVQVIPLPTSTFSIPPSVCANSPVQINYTGGAPASANFIWNFGGGTVNSGSGLGPYSITWNTAGNPNVSLSVTDNGCPSTITTNSILVNPNPIAAFSTNAFTCPDDQNAVNFTGTADPGAVYNWNFGTANVISGSGAGPYTVSWNASGQNVIELIVEQNSCQDTSQYTVTVYPVPTSAFSLPTSACPGDTLQISYTGSAGAGSQFNWDFDGGNVISGTNGGPYQLVWSSGGNVTVSLIVTENGCISPPSQNNLLIANLPSVNAGRDTLVCSGTTFTIGNPPIAGLNYSWFPITDLSSPNSSSSSLQALNQGVVPVVRKYILHAVSGIGCTNTDTLAVTIDPVPVVAFTAPSAQCLVNNSFQFYVSGSQIQGAIYHWNFGLQANPPQSSLEVPPAVHFNQVGTYVVTLEATFGACVATPYSDEVRIAPDPIANFDALVRDGCVPLTVPFSNYSSGNGNTYLWTFSDVSSDTLTAATHVFNEPGQFTVSLLAQNQEGCTDFISYPDYITVRPIPYPVFVPSPDRTDILEPLIQFINSTQGINKYSWDFGDGDTSGVTNPNHMYRELGTYTVTLYATNMYGCRDTITGVVRIEDTYTFYIPNSFTPNGDGRNDFFGGFGTRFKAYHLDILDRWGSTIYSTNDYNQPWDGKVKNAVQESVYIYKIQITDNELKTHEFTGHVSVIR